ncbi:MAG: acyl-CoA dehydrogenase family protein, partial [Sneathiella sp.]
MAIRHFRRDHITKPIHRWARGALPSLSDTEAEALNAGDVWWEAELFSGNPDWSVLQRVNPPHLTDEEQAFIDGPCQKLCQLVDDWQVNRLTADLPEEAWQMMREDGFFGMIIPKEYGGLGFSALAHSEVVRLISSRSLVASVTIMVPNSLGPGELLLQFGTEAQKQKFFPQIAKGG